MSPLNFLGFLELGFIIFLFLSPYAKPSEVNSDFFWVFTNIIYFVCGFVIKVGENESGRSRSEIDVGAEL